MNSKAPYVSQSSVEVTAAHHSVMRLIQPPLVPLIVPIGLCSKKGVFQLMLQVYSLFHYPLRLALMRGR